MNPNGPARQPLAPTSINAILASPIVSPSKSTLRNQNTDLITLPPIGLNRYPDGTSRTPISQSLPHLSEAISPELRRRPLPTSGMGSEPRPNIPPPYSNTSRIYTPIYADPIPAAPPVPFSGLPKRKADDISDDSGQDGTPNGTSNADDCDQIRRKIHNLIESGTMPANDFMIEIECNFNAYSRFMSQDGPDKGSRSDVYRNALQFFRNREPNNGRTPAKKSKKDSGDGLRDVSDIRLEGESSISVPVYDSCDEIRKKIRAHLADPAVTQAGFLREIAKTYPDGRKIQSKVLNDFTGKRGEFVGNTTAVYYSSYVYFEKLRIRAGKDKSKHRVDMERKFMEEGGIDRKHRDNGKSYTFKGR